MRARLRSPAEYARATEVYGRPLTLARGEHADPALVEGHLRRLGYRRVSAGDVGVGEFYMGRRGWIVGRRPFRPVPELSGGGFVVARLDARGRIRRLEDGEGRRLTRAQLEPELLGRVGERADQSRVATPLSDVPEHLVQAVLTVEDQKFFSHHGLDYRRIAAAALANLEAGHIVQGGSTLTQQLAKNLYLHPRRSFIRKLREAVMALALEARYTKGEILQAYLNEVYLGQDRGTAVHGVGSASRYYFGKDVGSLTLAESALLAGMIKAPNAYSPYRNAEAARERRDLVLRVMRTAGVIGEEEERAASEEAIRLRERSPPLRSARYFVDWVVRGLDPTEDVRALITTLDPRLQRAAEEAVRGGIARLERDFAWLREGEAGEPLQAALVALDPGTGEVLALVGGRDYGRSQFNRATDGLRQPGSAFKPVVALSALARDRSRREGPHFTLASVLQDEPLHYETAAGVWEPGNYDGQYRGPVTLRDALERSLNVPFARLGIELGGERIAATARALGIARPLGPYPSLALGASEVTPLELTRAFGVLAAGGYRAPLTSIVVGADGTGRILSDPSASNTVDGTWAYDDDEVYLVTSALRGAVERGTGRGLRERGFRGDVAAKSGTTNDFRDAWFVGYTPKLAVGVWVGFDHGERLEIPGAGAALPIFARFLEEAVGADGRLGPWGSDGFRAPSGLEMVRVDPGTGLRGGWGCWGEPELFLEGTAPEDNCSGDRGWRAIEDLLERGGSEARRALIRLLERIGSGDGRR
ncbi:MAG: PBP1A family penicillin-binding protein [Gemmatimonadota bacterium]